MQVQSNNTDSSTEEEKYLYTFNNINGDEIKAFLPKFEIDMETMKQIKQMSEHNILKNIRIMPDCHRGHGCCVGLTAYIDDKIYPRYVGVDIGCGISMYPINIKLKPKKIIKVRELIHHVVPMGNTGRKAKHTSEQVREDDWEWLRGKNNSDLADLISAVGDRYPEYDMPEDLGKEYILNMLKRIGCKYKADILSVGTLGGGNHYVEVNVDSRGEKNYITVHSGSRAIGRKICVYHQEIIERSSKFDWGAFNTESKKIRRKCKVSSKVKEMEDELFKRMKEDLHPKYLEGHEMLDYLIDMIVGQNLASLNRLVMIRNVVENLVNDPFNEDLMVETRHNYIDFNRFIMRKGAISAEKDELCIVSLNMKDGVLLCKGKGDPDWNYSSAHGCGRIMSRTSAGRLNMKVFEKEMEGIETICVRKETLDESPMAYRDPELVKKCLVGSVEVIDQLRPIINCKGYE